MSSMSNHRKRSHRSEKVKRNAFGNMCRKNWICPATRPKSLKSIFRTLFGMGRQRESRSARPEPERAEAE